jgi:hypothetical protein
MAPRLNVTLTVTLYCLNFIRQGQQRDELLYRVGRY